MADQILMIYAYCIEMKSAQITGLFGLGSVHTAADWNNYFRDVCAIYLAETADEKIGGVGMKVEIDETKIFKNKNHVGRSTSEQTKGEWLFGGICRETGETFFVIVENRNAEMLIQVIRDKIIPGTHIISDCWRSYSNISLFGYTHATVNHSENFVDPTNSDTHTQTIERTWLGIKANIPKGSRYHSRISYIIQYGFKKNVGWYKMSCLERFNLMLRLIADYY
jgi:transposase-like protein